MLTLDTRTIIGVSICCLLFACSDGSEDPSMTGEDAGATNNDVDAGQSCQRDSECESGFLCDLATNLCAVSCTNDVAICGVGTTCVSRAPFGPGSICAPDTLGPGECNTARDCDAPDLSCVDNRCVEVVEQIYRYAQISDFPGDFCNNDGDEPGADIFAVELIKSGQRYAATAIGATITGESNAYTDAYSVLNGSVPTLVDGCPVSGPQDRFVSLGCGGDVVLQFVDSGGNMIEIGSSDTILVYEYGDQCPGGASFDSWQLSICDPTAREGEIASDSSACNGSVQGGVNKATEAVTISL